MPRGDDHEADDNQNRRQADAEHEASLHSRMLEQAAAEVPPGESEVEKATFEQARELLNQHHEDQALQLFRERAKGPYATAGAPYMLVGTLYLYMGRPDDADKFLHQALAIEPSVRGAHTYLGILALQQSDLPRAESEFRAEIAGEPNYQLAVAELGEVRYRQGRFEEAADQLSRSRTTAPSFLYMLCDSYFRLGKIKDANLTAELIVDYSKGDREARQRVVDLLDRNQQTELARRLSNK